MKQRLFVLGLVVIMGAACSGKNTAPAPQSSPLATGSDGETPATGGTVVAPPSPPAAGTVAPGGAGTDADGLVQPAGGLWSGYQPPAAGASGASGAAAAAAAPAGGGEATPSPAPPPSPLQLVDNDVGVPKRPTVACDTTGRCAVAWFSRDNDAATETVYARIYDGAMWQDAVALGTGQAVAGMSDPPFLGFDGNGNILLVWRQSDVTADLRIKLHGKWYVASAQSWENPGITIDDLSRDVYDPQVAVAANGKATVLWQQRPTSTTRRIYARTCNNFMWDGVRPLGPPEGHAKTPAVAMTADGHYTIGAWTHRATAPDYFDIVAQYHQGAWAGPPPTVDADFGPWTVDDAVLTTNAWDPQVLVKEDGQANVIWIQSDGAARNRFYSVDCSSAGCGSAEVINVASGNASAVQLGYGGGRSIGIWMENDASGDHLFTWTGGDPIPLTMPAGRFDQLQLVVNTQGRAAFVWRQFDATCTTPDGSGCSADIYINRFNGASWSGAMLLESDSSVNASLPQVALDGSDRGFVVWQQTSASGTYDIARYQLAPQ